jgi:sialidase-1
LILDGAAGAGKVSTPGSAGDVLPTWTEEKPMNRLAALALPGLLALPVPRTCADGGPTETTVFAVGKNGYDTYRIPSLLVTGKGTLLAFCEGRKNGSGDAGKIDLLLRRSRDGGKTWGATQVVWEDGDNTCGNPCPVLDRSTGTVWLLLTHNRGEDAESSIEKGIGKGTRTVWVCKSADDGETWSKPVEITRDVKRDDWTWYATGPGVGIQLKSGRLLVPCDNKIAKTRDFQSHVIYSDDHGATWKLGGVVGPACNECQAVELSDGSVMLNMRSYLGNNRRQVARSKDGGESFARPAVDDALIEPVCQASLIRYPGDKGGLLFCNPASTKREKMTVRLSNDDGKTWPTARRLYDGPSSYSCLAVLPDGAVGCLYERGVKTFHDEIAFARFTLDWLRDGKDADRGEEKKSPELTAEQLRAIMPRLTKERAEEFLGPLNKAMAKYDIDAPLRRAAFLAQLAHESGELRYMEEIASGEAYEGRKDLGNTEPGDGKRYKGRGPIQLTGRFNYRRAGEALGLDLEGKPELAATPEVGCQVAGWFWATRKLNALADERDFKAITKRVNGGYHGLEQRERYYRRTLEVLGADKGP